MLKLSSNFYFKPIFKNIWKMSSHSDKNYFIQNKILNKNQFGFWKNSSTNDAVIDVYNEIYYAYDTKTLNPTN